jgi:hypothetical protein
MGVIIDAGLLDIHRECSRLDKEMDKGMAKKHRRPENRRFDSRMDEFTTSGTIELFLEIWLRRRVVSDFQYPQLLQNQRELQLGHSKRWILHGCFPTYDI